MNYQRIIPNYHMSKAFNIGAYIKAHCDDSLPIISLGLGNPDIDCSDLLTKSANRLFSDNNVHQYSGALGSVPLRNRIIESSDVSIESVAITTGAKFALDLEMRRLSRSHHTLIYLTPCWTGYEGFDGYFENVSKPVVDVSLDYFDQLYSLITQVDAGSVIILNTPHNPSGKHLSVQECQVLIQFAENSNIYIVIDEVYSPYLFGGDEIDWYFKRIGTRSCVTYIGSFGKIFGVTGWRLGFMVAESDVIKFHSKNILASVGNVPLILQEILASEWDLLKAQFLQYCETLNERRDLIESILSTNIIDGGVGLFVMCYVEDDIKTVKDLMRYENIVVMPSSFFGDSTHPYVRISLILPNKDLKRAIDRIKNYL